MARALKSLWNKQKRLGEEEKKKKGRTDPGSYEISYNEISYNETSRLFFLLKPIPEVEGPELHLPPCPRTRVNPPGGLGLGVPGQRGLYRGETWENLHPQTSDHLPSLSLKELQDHPFQP